jgi:hypothetical protein
MDELVAELHNLKVRQKAHDLVVESLKEATKKANDQRDMTQDELQTDELVLSSKR